MKLLPFQRAAVDATLAFNNSIRSLSLQSFGRSSNGKQIDLPSMAWIITQSAVSQSKPYCTIKTLSGKSIPNVAIAIPTGGGKTVVGLSAAIELVDEMSLQSNKFILWMAPSDSIYKQIIKEFTRFGQYFDYVLMNYGREINLKQAQDTWTDDDLSGEKITILLLTYQSIIRKNNKNSLHIYRNADRVSALSCLPIGKENPSIYQLIKTIKPVIVIDESHRYYTEIGRDFFKQDELASFLVELTATPKQYSNDDYPNLVFTASGKMLIDEQLIKTPIVYHALQGSTLEDLISMVIDHQLHLETQHLATGSKVMPKVLISSEYTGKNMADQEYSAQNIKRLLIGKGISSDSIAIKSSELDELGDRNLDGPGERTRFIITKRALMEGWDCKSIFTIVMVNKIGAEVTNFQLIGRGLRQPNRRYKEFVELNELNIFTNSSSHDRAVIRLKEFLDDSGLSDSVSDLMVTSDNRKSYEFNPTINLEFDFLSPANNLLLNANLIKVNSFLEMQACLDKIVILDTDLNEPEEIVQRIDFSREQIFGLIQGRSQHSTTSLNNEAAVVSKLVFTLYQELSSLLPNASNLHSLIKYQLTKILNFRKAYVCRVDLLMRLKANISNFQLNYSEKYFQEIIVPTLSIKKVHLKDVLPTRNLINAIPDLGLEAKFKNCVLGNLPKSIFNNEELDFARYLDQLNQTVWIRCTPAMNLGFPYAGGNFYPDFGVYIMDKKNVLKTIFIETKGSHLLGNSDSNAKAFASEEISKISPDTLTVVFGSFSECKEVLNRIIFNQSSP
jgi:superfamily II DNA or RNA helicase